MVSLPTWLMAAALSMSVDVEVVKFTADWCKPCHAMEPALEQLSERGYRITRIDVERRADVARQYRVNSVPTLLLVANGRIVDRVEGAVGLGELQQRLQRIEAATNRHTPATAGSRSSLAESHGRPPSVGPASASDNPRRVADGRRRDPEGEDAERLALQSTVRLRVADAHGNSFGSGTIVHVHGQDALVLTCGHLFRDSQGKGDITVDLFAPGATGPVTGQLIRYDLKRDLALVGIRSTASLRPVPIAGSAFHVALGQRLFSVGCDRGRDASVLRGQLKAVNKYIGPENLVVSGQPVDGRSGGGLFTYDGRLVGVCNAADPELNEGLYAAFASVHRHLDDAALSFVYRPGSHDDATPLASTAEAVAPDATTRVVPARFDQPRSPAHVDPLADAAALASGARGMEPDDAEVICIIRPKNRPDAASQVVVIERPSRAFIAQLNREQQDQRGRLNTQLRRDSSRSRRDQSERH